MNNLWMFYHEKLSNIYSDSVEIILIFIPDYDNIVYSTTCMLYAPYEGGLIPLGHIE